MQAVQQDLDRVKAEIQEVKHELAAVEQAGDEAQVDLLRNKLTILSKKEGYTQAIPSFSDLSTAACALVLRSLCSMAAGKIAHVSASIFPKALQPFSGALRHLHVSLGNVAWTTDLTQLFVWLEGLLLTVHTQLRDGMSMCTNAASQPYFATLL